MPKRKHIPTATETQVFTSSRRRCCICFGLNDDFAIKKGQITHLDHEPSNWKFDNLAWMCLDHHDEYDSRTSQSKGMTIREAKHYRKLLYARIDNRQTQQGTKVSRTKNQIPAKSLNVTITAEEKVDSFPVNTSAGFAQRECGNLHVRVVNKNKDYPINVGTLHFVTRKLRIPLEEFHQIYTYGTRPFTVPADNDHVYYANGSKLAKNLRDAGYKGNVEGFIELGTKTDEIYWSDKISYN